jgi:hypothetical protein
MENVNSKDDISRAIATIEHNLECLEEALKSDETNKKEFLKEYCRLKKLLSHYLDVEMGWT